MSKGKGTSAPPVPAAAADTTPAANWDEHVRQTLAKLHNIYLTLVKPLEDRYKYDLFRPSWFEETILNQRPFVTFFGPWSAGKSTFINHLLQNNYLWTGPQPTTAEFTVLVYGEEPGPLDGRVLVNAKDLPFKGLNEFGEGFLQNFQGFQAPHEILKAVTLIDTPGVLESAKEIHQRKYDYIKLSRWFAERSDLIFVMFDPTKLDAGMELRMMFKHAFKGMEGKVRIVLNKSDSVNTQELMRVYGSLFWNLSNMINSTEPPRVYVGSFWDQPYQPGTFHLLFSEEKTDLIHELTEVIPAQALDKKIASLIRRAKDVFIHAIIIGGMRSELPMFFGKEKAKRKALDALALTYEKVGGKFKMNWRDFPPVDEYRTFLEKFDLEQFPELEKVEKEGLLSAIRNCIDTVLPRLIRPVKQTAILDPRNKEQRKDMQELYHNSVRQQYEGKQGIQGSSDVVQSGLRTSAVPKGANGTPMSPASQSSGYPQQQQLQQQQQPPQQQQQPQQQPPAPQGGMNPQMMQQMMQMMMAQGQPMNPAMMQQMMMMMQQPQQQQQQPSGNFQQPPQQQSFQQQQQPSATFQQSPSAAYPPPQMQPGNFQQQPSAGGFPNTMQSVPPQQMQNGGYSGSGAYPPVPQQQPSGTFQQQPSAGGYPPPIQQQPSAGGYPPPMQSQPPQQGTNASPAPQQGTLAPSPSMPSECARPANTHQDPSSGNAPSLEQQQQEQQRAIQQQMLMMQQMVAQQQLQQQQQPAAGVAPSAPQPEVASATAPSQYDDDEE